MNNEGRRALLDLYAIPYWATQLLTWLFLPLHQFYEDAGDFTVRARLKTSARENGLFYGVLAVIGLLGMLVLVVTKGVSVAGITSGAVALSLSFSIATGVFLMGYGFSEIPRVCWLRSSLTKRTRWCEPCRPFAASPHRFQLSAGAAPQVRAPGGPAEQQAVKCPLGALQGCLLSRANVEHHAAATPLAVGDGHHRRDGQKECRAGRPARRGGQ